MLLNKNLCQIYAENLYGLVEACSGFLVEAKLMKTLLQCPSASFEDL